MLHEDDAPPTFFEYNFFKKYMPHLGIFMEPVDIRYRVVMKTKSKKDAPTYANLVVGTMPGEAFSTGDTVNPLSSQEFTGTDNPVISVPPSVKIELLGPKTSFIAMVGPLEYKLIENIHMRWKDTVHFTFHNQLNVKVSLRVLFSPILSEKPIFVHEVTVVKMFKGFVNGTGSKEKGDGNHFKLVLKLNRNDGEIKMERVTLKMKKEKACLGN